MNLHPFWNIARTALVACAFIGLTACGDDSSSTSNNQQPAQSTQSAPAKAATPSQPAAQAPELQGEASLDVNLYVVFDGSGSMDNCPPIPPNPNERNYDGHCQRKINGAKEAVAAVVKTLPPHTNLGLYVFDNNGRSERVKLGPNNSTQFLNQVSRIVAGDGTPLGPAMDKGARALEDQYKKQLGYGEYRLVVVTDGMPDYMSDVTKALDGIKKSGVPISIYTIGFGMNDPNHPLRKASVTFWAAYTGEQVKDALQKSLSESQDFDPSDFQTK
jgi:Ca-activated chloride channel family protein